MANKCYGICSKCKGSDIEEIKAAILDFDAEATFDDKCQSNCGPGMHEPFVRLDDKFYIGEDVEEIIEQLEDDLN